MALHYLLDGYNIIKQISFLAKQPWEDGRASLVKTIENERPQGSNPATILFDGRPGRVDTPGTAKVKVIFTDEQSADDCIKKIVADAGNKRVYVVVTDDRQVRYHVRALGAKVLGVSEFLNKIKSHHDKKYLTKKSTALDKDVKIIPYNLELQITTELEQIWLGKGKTPASPAGRKNS